MTTVTPPPPAPPAPPSAPPPPVTVTVAQPPSALLDLALGTRLEGLVRAIDPTLQKILVQTPLGPVPLQLSMPLPIPADARLVLQLTALSPTVQFWLLSIDGAPPSAMRPGGSHAPAASTPPGSPPPAAAPAATDRINVGTLMQATLVRPASSLPSPSAPDARGGPPAPDRSPRLPPSGNGGAPPSRPAALAAFVADRLSAVVPEKVASTLSSWFASARNNPTVAPGAGREAAILGRGAAGTAPPPSASSSATPSAAQPGSPLDPPPERGTVFTVRVNALHGPTAAPQSGGPLAPGQTLLATVVSSTPGHTIVETDAGTLVLKTPGALSKGLGLALEIAGPVHPPETDAARPSPLSSRGWPALEEAVPILHRDAPDLHRVLIANLLPKPDSTLAAGIIMFLTALRTGDIRAWLGEDTVRALNRGRPDLARRIEGDFRELSRVADDTGGDWRVAVIPFNAQTSIEQLRLLTRRPPRDESGKDNDGARFVVDVTLSRLGRIQLDGLVRRKDKRLDLMVRTAAPLPQDMRNDIRRLFTRASEATGINGLLQFEARKNGFVEAKTADPLRGGFVA